MNALPKVNFFTAIGNGFKNYVNFSGRIRRSEYWFFMLIINFLTFFLLLLFMLYVTGAIRTRYYNYDYYYDKYNYPYYSSDYYNGNRYSSYYYSYYNDNAIIGLGVTLGIYVAAIMLPTLSATVRRLHDIGKRGEYIFIGLVPFFGGIALLALLCTDSMRETNEYGPSPKYTNNVNNYFLFQPQVQNVSSPAVAPLTIPLIQTNPSPVPMNMMNNNVNTNNQNNNINNNEQNNNNIIDNKNDVKNNEYSNV